MHPISLHPDAQARLSMLNKAVHADEPQGWGQPSPRPAAKTAVAITGRPKGYAERNPS